MSDPSALTSATSEQWDQLAELLVVTMPTDTAVDTVAHEACERERVNADPLRVRELCHRYIDYLICTRGLLKADRLGRETLRKGVVGTEYLGLWFLADSVARRWKLDLPERPPQQLRWCECDPPDATFRGLLNWCNLAEKAIAGMQQPISLTPKLGPMEENPYAPNPAMQAEAVPPAVDPYGELREYARSSLKGQERAVIESLCNSAGQMPLADLAVAEGVDFSDEVAGYKGVKRRLKDRLKKLGWELFQHDNEARLKRIGG